MSPLGNEDARAQVGTNGGLSQRWREKAQKGREKASKVANLSDLSVQVLTQYETAIEVCADELDAAKLRIEEAVKALPAYLHHGDTGPLSVSSRTAVLKIIREIL